MTGVGIPQLSAVMDTFQVAKKFKIPVIADGGIKTSGDIAKAIAGGASACMIGSLFAGTEESPGKLLTIKGKKFKSYSCNWKTGKGLNPYIKIEKFKEFDNI